MVWPTLGSRTAKEENILMCGRAFVWVSGEGAGTCGYRGDALSGRGQCDDSGRAHRRRTFRPHHQSTHADALPLRTGIHTFTGINTPVRSQSTTYTLGFSRISAKNSRTSDSSFPLSCVLTKEP